MMDDFEIAALWLVTKEYWPSVDLPDPDDAAAMRVKVTAWRDVLGDLPAGLVRKAIASLSGERFRPALGEVRQRALRIAAEEQGEAPMPDVDEAWGEVMRQIAHVGRYGQPDWSHPAIAGAVDNLGWESICNTLDADIGYLRSTFGQYYANCRARFERDSQPAMPALAHPVTGELMAGLDLRADRVLR